MKRIKERRRKRKMEKAGVTSIGPEHIKRKPKKIEPMKDTHNLIYLEDKDNLEL